MHSILAVDDSASMRQMVSFTLKNAGYNPLELDRVEPLLKQSERGEQIRKQMGGSAPAPEWKK